MSLTPEIRRELRDLLGRLRDGQLNENQLARLDALVGGNAHARRFYLNYVDLCASLHWARLEENEERGMAGSPTIDASVGDLSVGDVSVGDVSVGAAFELPHQLDLEPQIPNPPFPSLSTTHYPLPANFVGGPVFSYMVATVILGTMLLGAWAYKITHYHQIAEALSPAVSSSDRPELVFVGRITGMADCRWADPQTEAYAGASVPLDRKYALASGLMEITYKTGAKVILEGPCTYEVESPAGGYLSLGKLTAKVEKERSEVRGQRSDHYPLSTIHYTLFSVRTPTAIVTDLGTEFGVEVSGEGNTTSHVFRGSVKVQVVSPEKGTGPIGAKHPPGPSGQVDLSPIASVVLRANESARVERGKKGGEARLLTGGEVGDAPKFARRLVEPPKLLDLLDVVAGGNGINRRRERGIDPTTGMEDPIFLIPQRKGNRQFHRVTGNRLIDGVFVPDGGAGGVQIDSAGHTFDGFSRISGTTVGGIWARAADIGPNNLKRDRWHWVYSIGRGGQFMPDGRGLLCMHANVGFTFDIAAMRKLHKGARPARFRATVGLADAALVLPDKDPQGIADLWVFVDGRLKLQRKGLTPENGTINVNIEIGSGDRFLTLVVTDNNSLATFDWAVFGDPVLEMTPTDEED